MDEFKSVTRKSTDLRYGGEIGPDGEDGWHTFRFDWHTGGNASNSTEGEERRRVDFFVDGELVHSTNDDRYVQGPLPPYNASSDQLYVPTKGGRIWIGGNEYSYRVLISNSYY